MRKLRQPASRAEELVALRARLRAERGAGRADLDEERALAREVLARKLAVAEVLDGVTSCHSCARGQPWPRGGYLGGDCCGGETAELFGDDEVAALVHAGTRPRDLQPPARGDAHAGCAFRGPTGCSLELEHRPGRCIHYVCDTLRRELHRAGRLDDVEARLGELSRAMQRFVVVHRARLDTDVLASIVDAIAAEK